MVVYRLAHGEGFQLMLYLACHGFTVQGRYPATTAQPQWDRQELSLRGLL